MSDIDRDEAFRYLFGEPEQVSDGIEVYTMSSPSGRHEKENIGIPRVEGLFYSSRAKEVSDICKEFDGVIILEDIAKRLSITRERVRQIIRNNNRIPYTEEIIRTRPVDERALCQKCGKPSLSSAKTISKSRKNPNKKLQYRCQECVTKDSQSKSIEKKCDQCGESFLWSFQQQNKWKKYRKNNPNSTKKIFCGKKCSGQYIGRKNFHWQSWIGKNKRGDKILW